MRLFPLDCIEKGNASAGDWFFNAADQFMICDTSKKDVSLISMTHAFRFSDTLFRLDIRLLFWLSQSLYYICIFIFYFFLLIFPQIRQSTIVITISGSVFPTGRSTFISIRYKTNPITHRIILEIWISFSL